MYKNLLSKFFIVISSREMMLIICIIMLITSLPLVAELTHFVFNYWKANPTLEEIGEMQELIDGYGGILVAAGVFFEERETLIHLSHKRNQKEQAEPTVLETYLNLIAHHNGMGILLMGLFVEIGSQIMEMPSRVINTDGIEVYILAICLFLSYVAIIIQLDFIKDFGKTYFLKQYKNNQPDVH